MGFFDGAVGAVGGLIGGIANLFGQSKAQKQNNRFIAEQNQKNMDFQIDMFNRTNAYNSPAQQMARFKEAGLNPHLIYGQGSSGNASPAPLPAQQVQEAYKPDFSFLGDSAMSAQQNYIAQRNLKLAEKTNEASVANQNADTANKLVQNANIMADTANKMTDNRQKEALMSGVMQLQQLAIASSTQGIQKVDKDMQLIDSQLKTMEIGRNLTNAQINKISYEISNIVSQIKLRQIQGHSIDLKSIEQGFINQIRANGGNPNDPAWMHLLLDTLSPVIKPLQSGTKSLLKSASDGTLLKDVGRNVSSSILETVLSPFIK